MDIKLRRVTINDAVVLSEIAKQTFADTFKNTCTEDDMNLFLQQYFNTAQLEAELRDEDDFCFFAEADNTPVGYVRFKEDNDSFEAARPWKSLELKRIYVLKEYKGQGVAQQLMNLVLEYATQQQYELVFLGVWEHNMRARHFYEKYGFDNAGYMHDFPIGNTPQRDCWYWKQLAPKVS